MTNAIIMGTSGGANSIKGTDGAVRVAIGQKIAKGDFLTYDYYYGTISDVAEPIISFTDNHGNGYGFGSLIRHFQYVTPNSSGRVQYRESVVKCACSENLDGSHSKHPIIGVALQSGESLDVARIKKVTSNNIYQFTDKDGRTYYSSSYIPSTFKTIYEEALSKNLFGEELIYYINENYKA